MYPIDDLDERLRRAAMPDEGAVDRITSAALSPVRGTRHLGRVVPIAALLLVCVLALGLWWSRLPRSPRTTDRGDEVIWLRAPDGTAWILAGTSREMLPPGSCVVIAAGGTQ